MGISGSGSGAEVTQFIMLVEFYINPHYRKFDKIGSANLAQERGNLGRCAIRDITYPTEAPLLSVVLQSRSSYFHYFGGFFRSAFVYDSLPFVLGCQLAKETRVGKGR